MVLMKRAKERNSFSGVGWVSYFLASVRLYKQLAFEGFLFLSLPWIYYKVWAVWEHMSVES